MTPLTRSALVAFAAAGAAPTSGIAQPATPRSAPPPAAVGRVSVARPTVVMYFVVPDGAIDTLPDLATEADDWNYAAAELGDSLRARGFAYALVTEPRLRIASRGATPVTLALRKSSPSSASSSSSGYVFVRPGARPCLRRGYLEPDSVLAIADRFLAPRATRSRERCDAPAASPRTP